MRNTMIFMTFAASCLFGETANGWITTKVPFAFEANGVKMEAGEYSVSHMPSRGLVAIRGRADKTEMLFRATPGKDNRERSNGLVFHRYGDRYFLDGVAVATSSAVVQIPKAKAEKEIAKSMEPETIVTAP